MSQFDSSHLIKQQVEGCQVGFISFQGKNAAVNEPQKSESFTKLAQFTHSRLQNKHTCAHKNICTFAKTKRIDVSCVHPVICFICERKILSCCNNKNDYTTLLPR